METKRFDYIIIGAGAAGLASAQYGARMGLKTVVLDAAGAGGQAMQITDLENYPGAFPAVSGPEFMSVMENQAKAFGAEIIQTNVSSIDKKGDLFVVAASSGIFEGKALCIATGAIHKNLGVPGEAEFTGRGVSYCAVCDGPFFRNKKILVVGGGDSACSEAAYLSTLSDDVKILHRRGSFRAQKAVVDKMLKAGVVPVYNTVIKKICGDVKVTGVEVQNVETGEASEISCDGIFIFAGMQPETKLVEMLPKDEGGYIITDENMMTAMSGVFAAGDVRSKNFRQVVTAVSDGAVAAFNAAKLLGK